MTPRIPGAALAAAALCSAALTGPATASPLNGCTAASASSCSFVATGDVRYVAAGLAGCTIEVIRSFSTIYTFSGNLPPTGVITQADNGDRVRVTAGFASTPAHQTRCDARDAQ